MNEKDHDTKNIEARLRGSEDQLRLAEEASGVGTFELDLMSDRWEWTRQVNILFGFDPRSPKSSFMHLEKGIFGDDVPKLHAAIEAARLSGIYHVEFRVRHSDGTVHWLAGKGRISSDESNKWLRGAYYKITDRKVLEARLLALNET